MSHVIPSLCHSHLFLLTSSFAFSHPWLPGLIPQFLDFLSHCWHLPTPKFRDLKVKHHWWGAAVTGPPLWKPGSGWVGRWECKPNGLNHLQLQAHRYGTKWGCQWYYGQIQLFSTLCKSAFNTFLTAYTHRNHQSDSYYKSFLSTKMWPNFCSICSNCL